MRAPVDPLAAAHSVQSPCTDGVARPAQAAASQKTWASAPVLVFDSGVGGLSVLRSLRASLPSERFIYVADSAHVPYGDKPHAFIVDRTLAIAAYAHDRLGAKAFVIACNTATAAAIEDVRQRWPEWVVVGIEPAVKPAALQTRSGVIGILATSNTLASERFKALVQGFAADCAVVAQPCPGLVECIEAGDLDGPLVRQLLEGYVARLTDAGADVIVLGCTHYPFVAPLVAELAGGRIPVLETGDAVARETRRRLEASQRLAPEGAGPAVEWLSTGSASELASSVRVLLGLQAEVKELAC